MQLPLTRRNFLAATAAAGISLQTAGRLRAAQFKAAQFKTTLQKALIGVPDEKTLAEWKQAGFEGMEVNWRGWKGSLDDAAAVRDTAGKLGMRLQSVLFGWTNFNSSDMKQVAGELADVEAALRGSAAFGADVLLLVPCRIDGMPIPKAHEFDIAFDEKTGRITRVVAGDNSPYQEYIHAHNYSAAASRRVVEKLIPVAEKTGVVIGLENVWNNLWVTPPLFRQFVASFDSPWVQAYFDIGNHVKYAPPEEWILTLGKLIAKCHVKDFTPNPDRPNGGDFKDIREGSVDWPAVRKALDQIGYNGWMTIEGSNGLSVEDRSQRLDLIIAGK